MFWKVHQLIVATFVMLLLVRGSKALTLTSIPVSEGGDVSACSGTTVIVTCSATQVGGLKWTHLPGSRVFTLNDNGTRAVVPPYTVSLVNATARSERSADLVSVLEVMINDISNGTTVTCQATPNDTAKSLTLYKESPPSSPSNFMVMNYTFQPETFSILLSWEPHYGGGVVSYRISINTSTPQEVSTNLINVTLEGEYSTPLEIQLFAMNCAGNSTKVTLIVYQENSISTNDNQPSIEENDNQAGCPPPSPPANGRVSNFTSSRVGAQVTYHCDTDLVLVGESVATCSPSLQWTPSSEEVMCGQPPGPMVASGNCSSASSSLSTGDVVAITTVVTGLCSLITGLLLGVLLTQCVHCHRKTDQTKRPPVYEDIPSQRKTNIELKCNEAYGHINV